MVPTAVSEAKVAPTEDRGESDPTRGERHPTDSVSEVRDVICSCIYIQLYILLPSYTYTQNQSTKAPRTPPVECRVKPDCTGLPCVRDTPARVPPTSTPRTQITVHFSVWSRALRPRRIRSPRFAIHAPSQLCLYPAPNNSLLALPARTASVCAC